MNISWRDFTSLRRAQWPLVRGALPRKAVRPDAQLLVVVAPAGYGKTTALARTLPESGRGLAWLTLDADDADPQVLAAGLTLAVAELPGGSEPASLMDAGTTPARVVAKVADVLHRHQAWLVVDEAHHLVHPALAPLVRELLDCGHGHIALLSRLPLQLTELTPLEAAGVVQHLGVAHLSFNLQEMGQLFEAEGLTPNPVSVRLAHSLTEGWPIAARFLVQAVAQRRVRLDDLHDLDSGQAELGTLFNYLAHEVLGPLQPALRNLLVRSSVFEELTSELLEAVLELPEAGAFLETLTRSGTLLTRLGENTYRAHPLLRAHLRHQLTAAQISEIAARGATFFEQTNRPRRALAAHLMTGHVTRAAALLEEHGASWVEVGRVSLIERSLARLPAEIWTPRLHALAGDTHRLSSRYEAALEEYRQAGAWFGPLGQVQVALDTVQPQLAWAALTELEALARPEQLDQIRLLRAENLLNAGRLDEAVALEPALKRSVRYALRSGQVDVALERARQATAGEVLGSRAARNHREGLLLASFLYSLLGQSAQAMQAAREGMAEGERLGSPFVLALSLARYGHACQVAGDLPAAVQAYEQALGQARDISGRLQVEALMGLGFIAASEGDRLRAEQFHQQALAQVAGDAYMAGLLHLMLGLGLIRSGQSPGEALDQAQSAFEGCGDRLGLAAVDLGRFAAQGTPETAQRAVQAVLRYPFLLATHSQFSPLSARAQRAALLARLGELAPEAIPALQGVARELGYGSFPGPADAPGFEVHVQVLGRLHVRRSDQVPLQWGRAKARDLLLMLVVQSGGISRQTAQEMLFPESELGVGERNFRVTLHALAAMLEEGAVSGTFVERGEWLRLRPGPDLHIDYWEAQRVLAQAAGTPGRLGALLTLPTQVVHSELDVVTSANAVYSAALLAALADEAQRALTLGDTAQASTAAEACLNLDPTFEPAARILLRVHFRRGNAAAAQRVYQALQASLDELGLRPMPETVTLYQALRQ